LDEDKIKEEFKDFESNEVAYNMITSFEENKDLYIYNETGVHLSYETKRKYKDKQTGLERLNVEKKKKK